jgi:hypothetical protein
MALLALWGFFYLTSMFVVQSTRLFGNLERWMRERRVNIYKPWTPLERRFA